MDTPTHTPHKAENSPAHTNSSHQKGFSLVEMAIVLVIIGILSVVLVPIFVTSVERGKHSDSKKGIETMRELLVGYAIAHKRLPSATEFSTSIADTDVYGNDFLYAPAESLTTYNEMCQGNRTSTLLNLLDTQTSPGAPTTDLAFFVSSNGKNQIQQVADAAVSGNRTLTTYTQGDTVLNKAYDDMHVYATLNYLKYRVCSSSAPANATSGETISFAENFQDFTQLTIPSSGKQTIAVNESTSTIYLGNGQTGSSTDPAYGCLWYKGDIDSRCTGGLCEFGTGLRAHFDFAISDVGEGFTFAVINGNNDTDSCGYWSEDMGYAGDNLETESIAYPKFAIEFDSAQQAGVITSGTWDGDHLNNARKDPDDEHVALVWWGFSANATNNPFDEHPLYDDNVHGNGANGTVNPLNAEVNADAGLFEKNATVNWTSGATVGVRIDIIRNHDSATNQGTYTVQCWLDCNSANCKDLTSDYSTLEPTDSATVQAQNIVLSNDDDFTQALFGWTQGSASDAQNIAINNFTLQFR